MDVCGLCVGGLMTGKRTFHGAEKILRHEVAGPQADAEGPEELNLNI